MVTFVRINEKYAQVVINCKSVCVVNRKESEKLLRVLVALGIPYAVKDNTTKP